MVLGTVNRFKYAHAIAFSCLLNWVNFSLDHYVTLYLDINSVFKNQDAGTKCFPDRLDGLAIIAYVIDGLGTRLDSVLIV